MPVTEQSQGTVVFPAVQSQPEPSSPASPRSTRLVSSLTFSFLLLFCQQTRPKMLAARSVLRTQAQLASAARVNTVARALSTSSVAYDAKQRADSMQRVTVFGAGLMGAGIAQVSAQAGLKVTLTDVTDKALENGINIIKKSVARVAKKQQPDDIEGFTNKVLQNISTSTDAGAAVADTDLVVEAILENLKVKQDLFAFLDTKAKKDTIFASNTSSLSIGEIALKCSEERQTQFAGLHFFNREC